MPKFAAVPCGDCAMAVHLPVDDGPTHVCDYTGVAMLSSLWKMSRRAIIVHGEVSLAARHGPLSVHKALLFRQLSDEVTFFAHQVPHPGDEAWAQMAARTSGW